MGPQGLLPVIETSMEEVTGAVIMEAWLIDRQGTSPYEPTCHWLNLASVLSYVAKSLTHLVTWAIPPYEIGLECYLIWIAKIGCQMSGFILRGAGRTFKQTSGCYLNLFHWLLYVTHLLFSLLFSFLFLSHFPSPHLSFLFLSPTSPPPLPFFGLSARVTHATNKYLLSYLSQK